MSTNPQISEKTAEAVNKHFMFATGAMRLRIIRTGLRIEILNPGMRLTAKTPKCSTILRREFGLSGKPVKLLALFEELLVMTQVIDADDTSTELGPDGKHQLTAQYRRD